MSQATESANRMSPRERAGFTIMEFVRGALIAWGVFVVVAALTHGALLAGDLAGSAPAQPFGTTVVAALHLAFFALPWIGPWSLAGLIIGAPLAYWLARALRGASRSAQLAALAGLGLVLGLAVMAIQGWVTAETHPRYPLAILLGGLIAGGSVAFGWWATMRIARRPAMRALRTPASSA